jgi:serine/threonine-protein kinase
VGAATEQSFAWSIEPHIYRHARESSKARASARVRRVARLARAASVARPRRPPRGRTVRRAGRVDARLARMFVCAECGAAQPAPGRCPADGGELLPIGDDVLLGQTLGAYRIARLLGVGGMGRVYKGVHPQIGSRVAIKVLSRECSDRRDLVDRFFAEAKAVNLIRHENIVNVLDLSMLPDGRPYIVMEYLDGAPLASIVDAAQRRGPLPLGGIARLCAEVLDALGAAHQKTIIHRDLKPDNIFVTPAGHAKVLDFGIAKLHPELGGSMTHTGSLLGTPHYMSPEQAAGQPVDMRTDLYAIGVILFELATLRKPFVADSLFELLKKQVEMPPPPPRSLRPDMPPDMEHVIVTALAKQPEHRFGSAQAMSAALQHATSQLPPEQWAPISTTATSSGKASPSWHPTPMQQRVHHQHPSTLSAGQVTAPSTPPKKRGKRGVWIALAAVLLVGGGITAAVLATGGDGDSSGTGDKTASADPPSTSKPSEPATKHAKKPDKPDKPAGDKKSSDDDLDDFDAQIKDAEQYMTADQIKQLEAARKLAKQALDESKDFDAADSQKKPTSPPGAPPKSADGWVQRASLTPPTKIDYAHVDVGAFVTWATSQAKLVVPDAELNWISADGVYPDGHADLTLKAFASDHGMIDVRFYSPSHAKRDPKTPRGVKSDAKCMFRIWLQPGGIDILDMSGFGDCEKHDIVPAPRCTFAKVWSRVLARHADLKDAVAEIIYTRNIVSHKVVWMFDIHDVHSEQLPDGC